jgi:hypothetical protein
LVVSGGIAAVLSNVAEFSRGLRMREHHPALGVGLRWR